MSNYMKNKFANIVKCEILKMNKKKSFLIICSFYRNKLERQFNSITDFAVDFRLGES